MAFKAAHNLYSYVEHNSDSNLRKVPCAYFFILLLSFSSFWSLLMVGCSNDNTFSFRPFIFSIVQLFMTCLWCNIYCSVASYVQKNAFGDNDYMRPYWRVERLWFHDIVGSANYYPVFWEAQLFSMGLYSSYYTITSRNCLIYASKFLSFFNYLGFTNAYKQGNLSH